MPPLPGEETLVTVYADIHYYFAPPSIRPVLHRFDKASYFYVYYNSTRQSSRVEIANNAGTPDQDAFHGYLDRCRVINSHRFPTLLTIVVDATGSASSSPISRPGRDLEEWRLASNDPRDPGKTKYRLHTLDIYFWAQEDARLVVDNLKTLLPPAQLDVAELEPDDEPPQDRHQEAMSPVVQNLENVAISDPSYQNGQTRNSQGQPQQSNLNPTIPPPPQQQQPPTQQPYQTTSSVSPVSAMSGSDPKSAKSQEAPQNFTPLAYNPAAPAPPEPIAHREDTPPPPDDGQGIGLAAATVHDKPAYAHTQPQQQWTGVPQPGHTPYQIGQPPTHAQGYGSPPAGAPTSFSGSPSAAAQSYIPSPPDPHAQHYAQQQSVETPGAQFYPSNPNQPHKALQHIQPQYADYLSANNVQKPSPPVGGYSTYNYAQQHQQSQQQQQQPQQPQQTGATNPYNVHNQVYRPTEQEHAYANRPTKRESAAAAAGGEKSKWESRGEKLEKKGGKFLKKLGI